MHMTSNMGTVEVLRPTPIVEDVSIGTAAELTATTKEEVNVLEYDCFCNFSVLTCARYVLVFAQGIRVLGYTPDVILPGS